MLLLMNIWEPRSEDQMITTPDYFRNGFPILGGERTYPQYRAFIVYRKLMADIALVIILKLILIAIGYAFLKGYFDKAYFPFMPDQKMYFTDVNKIIENIALLFQRDAYFLSHNTMYSRVVGIAGFIFWFIDPYLVAVLINLACTIITGILAVKIYYLLVNVNYINPRYLFYTICLSPTLNAYSLLVLRDIMIVCFFTLFMYLMIKNNWLGMFLVLCVFVFLRPMLALFFPIIVSLRFVALWTLKSRWWWLWFMIFSLIILIGFYVVGVERILWITNYLDKKFEGDDVARVFGMGFMSGTNQSNISGKTGIIIRLLTADGLLLPIVSYIFFIPSFIKSNRQIRVLISILVVMHFSMGIAYLAAFDSFTGRKLVMFMPTFYALLFYYFNLRRSFQRQKSGRVATRLIWRPACLPKASNGLPQPQAHSPG